MALSDFRGRRVLLWVSRGVFCALCRVAMSQLQRSYPEFQKRSTSGKLPTAATLLTALDQQTEYS